MARDIGIRVVEIMVKTNRKPKAENQADVPEKRLKMPADPSS